MKRLAVAAVALAVLATSSSAFARRPATQGERDMVAAALTVPARCINATVSTVDSAWSRVDPRRDDGCPVGNGFIILHLENYAWKDAYQANEIVVCPLRELPTRVARDLRVCRPSRTYVLCRPRGERYRVPRSEPSRCDTLGPRDSFAEGANLARLRWRGLGRSVATGRGIERGYHLPLSRIPVRLRAYRLRRDCVGDFVYTRLKATSRYGSTTVKFPTCPD